MDKIILENFSLSYSDGTESLHQVSLAIPEKQITVLFGPAGGGKSTLLRALNRLNDLTDIRQQSGRILLDGVDIYASGVDVAALRRKVSMVFATPVVLPFSIRRNVLFGLELAGEASPKRLKEALERSLVQAALWDEISDRLDDPAVALSGGQQQRLCLARSLALQPEVILLDEPTSGLDPISTSKVENSLQELKRDYTIVLVPHSVQQAARTADMAAFFLQGELVESAPGKALFTNPRDQRTQDYVEGRFG
jgi:phosphate transport system ATP-binding protein